MKHLLSICFIAFIILFTSCVGEQTQNPKSSLSATGFYEKIKDKPAATILDVRTAAEFSKGHLQNAKNIDWNGDEFENQIKDITKSEPVYVYCLSGARSSAAAAKMRSEGFKEVYELAGGIMKWRGANLPETTDNKYQSKGMGKPEFEALLSSDKLVLIDFYADWCAPCKKMKPYMEEISKDMADCVIVIRINTDDNQFLCKELHIDALPTLQLYKNKLLSWTNTGFIEKEEVLKHL